MTLPLLLALAALLPADRAFIPALRASDPTLKGFHTLARVAATDSLDIVVVHASQRGPFVPYSDFRVFWGSKQRIGVFLQDRSDAGLYYTVAIEAGPNDDCMARVERVTNSEVVISCIGEKMAVYDTIKYLYDARAKGLVKKVTYRPFAFYRFLETKSGRYAIACDEHRILAVKLGDEAGQFEVLSEAASAPLAARVDAQRWRVPGYPEFVMPELARGVQQKAFGPGKRFSFEPGDFNIRVLRETDRNERVKEYSLPATPIDEFIRARGDQVLIGNPVQMMEMNGGIGPAQIEGNRLWFGKSFYDGEGSSGVGGFGYFDFDTRRYTIFTAAELARWSVSALLVEPQEIVMALIHNGEWGGHGGGLAFWDRDTHELRRLWLPDIAGHIIRHAGALVIATRRGITVIRDDAVTHYFLDETSDGRRRMVTRMGVQQRDEPAKFTY